MKKLLVSLLIIISPITLLADNDLTDVLRIVKRSINSMDYSRCKSHLLKVSDVQHFLKQKLPKNLFKRAWNKWKKSMKKIRKMGYEVHDMRIKEVTFVPEGDKLTQSLIASTVKITVKNSQKKIKHVMLYFILNNGKWKISAEK